MKNALSRIERLKEMSKHPLFRIGLIASIVILLLISCDSQPAYQQDKSLADDFSEADLSFEGKKIILTRHARCRMDCRKIDAYEIQEVINQGHINARKSKKTAPPGKGMCPTTAYEGSTRDNQFVRVILGTCETPKIITVIDLRNNYNCTCK